MIRVLIALSVVASAISVALPIVMGALKHAFHDDRSAWYFVRPDIEKPYICKQVRTQVCDTTWSAFQGNCYIAHAGKKIRSDGRLHCEAMDGSLVSIHSDAENAFVSKLCMELPELSDGSDADGKASCFIGLTQSAIGAADWSWDDGSVVNYTRWGRAPRLVGDYEAVAINGNWVVAGIQDVLCLVVNAIVMCGSTLMLMYAAYAHHVGSFKAALGADAICSLMCIIVYPVWGLGHSHKDPARVVPVVVLCLSQAIITCAMLCVQLCFAGLEPNWYVKTPPIQPLRAKATPGSVQPLSLPPE
eukprot:TRINITY_DN54388_c0_g1_i1.p1 TRINITY_DN54388_c0_g1~~TRINITY_DN54388_c0_g1_i1.p1  ORF type:complete len:302 (-),score=28.27 TRINITY_DN54388_c0_g1_i1:506-1411(-)